MKSFILGALITAILFHFHNQGKLKPAEIKEKVAALCCPIDSE
jgi:hypothetical protein